MKCNPIPENKNCSVSKDQSIARNRELFCEMARVGNMNNELEVWVRTDDGGNLPHFHIWDKNSQGGKFHTCVQIKQPAYFHHTCKEGVLNTSQRKELVEFLKSKPTSTKKFSSFWEAILTMWNLNNSAMMVDEEQPMPDYTTIACELPSMPF